jgi:redox-sensitive bicupin YhaK (pirin superfamily)
VRHQDSRGNDQVSNAGEVQWMHSSAGIIHSEKPTQNLVEQKEKQEIKQLWINSPANNKMQQPLYQYSNKKEIVRFSSENKKINNKLIAGTYKGKPES